jgi:hypothetical protein
MTNTLKRKSILGSVIFIIIIFGLSKYSDYSGRKKCNKHIKELNFNGIIVRKYLDEKQHNYAIIEVKALTNNIQKVNLTNEKSGLFNFAQKNDSIIKHSGDLKVHLFRASRDTIFVLNKMCI